MGSISGNLKDVTGSPTSVTRVMVRAERARPQAGGVTTTEQHAVTVGGGGEVNFTLRPGPATLLLMSGTTPWESIPLLATAEDQTLAEAIEAAETYAGEDTRSIASLADRISGYATSAQEAARKAAALASEKLTAGGVQWKHLASAVQEKIDGKVDESSVDWQPTAYRIPKRLSDGQIQAGNPKAGRDVVTLSYLNDHASDSKDSSPGTWVQRATGGEVLVPTSPSSGDAATAKSWVQGELGKKADKTHTHAVSEVSGGEIQKVALGANEDFIVRRQFSQVYISVFTNGPEIGPITLPEWARPSEDIKGTTKQGNWINILASGSVKISSSASGKQDYTVSFIKD